MLIEQKYLHTANKQTIEKTKIAKLLWGCSLVVECALWVRAIRVRFPTAPLFISVQQY